MCRWYPPYNEKWSDDSLVLKTSLLLELKIKLKIFKQYILESTHKMSFNFNFKKITQMSLFSVVWLYKKLVYKTCIQNLNKELVWKSNMEKLVWNLTFYNFRNEKHKNNLIWTFVNHFNVNIKKMNFKYK